jgi:hypothetical protein
MDAVILIEGLFIGGVVLALGAWELWSLRRERLRREKENR